MKTPDDDPFEEIEITNEAQKAIRGAALPDRPFKQTGGRLPNGDWAVPFRRSTIEQLKQVMLRGESLSDAIVRLVHTRGRPLQ